MDCQGLDNPTDGTISVTATTYGATATYACDTGYERTAGDATRTCQDDETWSGEAATCTSKTVV